MRMFGRVLSWGVLPHRQVETTFKSEPGEVTNLRGLASRLGVWGGSCQ